MDKKETVCTVSGACRFTRVGDPCLKSFEVLNEALKEHENSAPAVLSLAVPVPTHPSLLTPVTAPAPAPVLALPPMVFRRSLLLTARGSNLIPLLLSADIGREGPSLSNHPPLSLCFSFSSSSLSLSFSFSVSLIREGELPKLC